MRALVLAATALASAATLAAPAGAEALTLTCAARAFTQTIEIDFPGQTVVMPAGDLHPRGAGPFRAHISDTTIQWTELSADGKQAAEERIDRTSGVMRQKLPNLSEAELRYWSGAWICRPAEKRF